MNKKERDIQQIFEQLFSRYSALDICRNQIWDAFCMLVEAYKKESKLLIVGNGGSAADSEHIVGELMKSFLFRRRIKEKDAKVLRSLFGAEGFYLAEKLEGALPALALPSMTALLTANINDNDPELIYAQILYGCGKKGDILLAISTSGNSSNIINACMTAKCLDMKVIGLTGQTGGKLKYFCDTVICVPAIETFAVQEYHLPVYHTLCAMLEASFFREKKSEA